ncbi:MAG TPA: thymidine phosphorylase [bacterium]|nr:thymidine phosphorylase [bacterium]
MNPVDIIIQKRDGLALPPRIIKEWVDEYVGGRIPDYQMSSFLMAVYFQGMNREELRALTLAMIESGRQISLRSVPGVKVDKHSTGGVGDKVSLILAPLAAAAGVKVPMMSGRGLGHTGGTLDKLEAIPGLTTNRSENELVTALKKEGFAMIGQSENVVPADRMLYALRDVTGTVSSIPLICSSIISKKKAEGADALVLDVKVGSGAFFPSREDTEKLAEELVRLGCETGLRTVACMTAMDQPLGKAVGNWLETREALEALKGEGPEDVMAVTETLGGIMMVLGERSGNVEEGMEIIRRKVRSGEGFARFRAMVLRQGGDVRVIDDPDRMPRAVHALEVKSEKQGFVQSLDARRIGRLAVSLGAGRIRKEDKVDPLAGIVLDKKSGDEVNTGERLAVLYSHKQADPSWEDRLREACLIGPKPVQSSPLILSILDSQGRLNLP